MSETGPAPMDSRPLAQEVEALRERYEAALRRGERPDFKAWLPADGPARRPALVELVRLELEHRRRAGEEATSEEYLARYPELRDGPAAPPAGPNAMQDAVTAAYVEAPSPPGAAASGSGQPVVPGYEILGELGRGGMGVVYKARHLKLNRVVALKMILAGGHAGEAQLVRFKAEAEAVARLQHPNIVQIFEVGEQGGLPFFSLEFCPGGSLDEKLAGTPLPPNEAANLVETLARAVHVAHQQHVIHRDLKPANVLLAADGSSKITDFGLAKKQDAAGHTQSGAVLGTPSYMAPEQAAGMTREIGPAVDVYALGAILYECLTGRPPFKAATLVETMRQVIADEPAPPRRLQPNVPSDLQTICLKCLEKDPRRRYADAAVLADDLRLFLDGRPIEARPTSLPERTWKWARRRPAEALLALACALGLAGLVAGLSVFAVQQGRLADAARANEKQANDAAAKEKAHGEELKKERDRAHQNLAQARQAIGELLKVTNDEIPNEPHLEGLRVRILEFARDLSQKLLEQQSEDPEVRLLAAQTTRLAGDMQESLNRLDDAIASYEAAAGLYEGLLTEPNPQTVWREEAANNLLQLWGVLMARGKSADASETLDRAEKLLEALSKEHPDNGDYQRDLALCWNNRGIQYLLSGDTGRGGENFQKAVDEFGRLPPDEQKEPGTQLEWAKAQGNLGGLYQRINRYTEAEAQYRQALDRLKQLVLAQPDVPAYAKELGTIYANLGTLLAGEGPDNYAAAQKVYDDAIDLCGKLGDKFSGVADYRHLLALAYDGRGGLFQLRGDADKARADLERARDLLGQLPNRSEYRVDEARVLNRLGKVESKADPEAARQSWQRALDLCEALPESDREGEAARAEFHRAVLALMSWYDGEMRAAAKAERWSDAAADLRGLADLRRKRLDAFASSPEAGAGAASAAALGPPAAALVPERLHEEQRVELATTLLASARLASDAGAYDDAGAALDALAQPGPDAPRRWARYSEAAAVAAGLAGKAAGQRQAFLDRSLALLRRAAAEGVAAPAGLLDSDAFAPLRDSPEFQQLKAILSP